MENDRSDFTYSHVHYTEKKAHGTCKPLFSLVKPYSHTMFTCVSSARPEPFRQTQGPMGETPPVSCHHPRGGGCVIVPMLVSMKNTLCSYLRRGSRSPLRRFGSPSFPALSGTSTEGSRGRAMFGVSTHLRPWGEYMEKTDIDKAATCIRLEADPWVAPRTLTSRHVPVPVGSWQLCCD